MSDLAAVLTGMANQDGGTILLGVKPSSGSVQGISDAEALIDKAFQAALQIDPPLVLPVPRKRHLRGKPVLAVTVPPGLPQAYNLEGRYLVRQGARTV